MGQQRCLTKTLQYLPIMFRIKSVSGQIPLHPCHKSWFLSSPYLLPLSKQWPQFCSVLEAGSCIIAFACAVPLTCDAFPTIFSLVGILSFLVPRLECHHLKSFPLLSQKLAALLHFTPVLLLLSACVCVLVVQVVSNSLQPHGL